MVGYWRAPALTNEVLRNDIIPGETLYRTGDLVFRRESGEYVYVDRADRVIKRGGVRISLIELAEALRTLAHVVDVACVAYDEDGELRIAAFVIPSDESSELALRRAAHEVLAETMLPDRIVFVTELPMTTSSKLNEPLLLSQAGLSPRRPVAEPTAN
jgi:acyl-coenzyme A synthetase/AMP-(fatty) acid ligase